MIIVIDSNEYINYLNKEVLLLGKIISSDMFTIYINETITKEILNNIKESLKKDFYYFLFANNIIAYNQKIPSHLLNKYKEFGMKKGDIAIAAFCEAMDADYIITENKHFLKSKKFDMSINRKAIFDHAQKSTIFDKFKVLSLKGFLKKLK